VSGRQPVGVVDAEVGAEEAEVGAETDGESVWVSGAVAVADWEPVPPVSVGVGVVGGG
jgi:hypothetical protein